jgi:hypothetical protein
MIKKYPPAALNQGTNRSAIVSHGGVAHLLPFGRDFAAGI